MLTIGASSALADQDITSSGPLNNIGVTSDLGCQVTYAGDTAPEFFAGPFPPGACGTFLGVVGFGLYGPTVPGGVSPTADFTSLSQSPTVTGAGTASSPYQVQTIVFVPAGPSGLTITETESYVVGQNYYRTDIVVQNMDKVALSATLFHAGDCYLQGNDSGYGWADPAGGGIYCAANPNNSPASGILGFEPLTSSSSFIEGYYANVWNSMTPVGFPGSCDCGTYEDNAAGLSWQLSLPAGGTSPTISLLTIMSPATGTSTNPTTPTTPTSPGSPGGSNSGAAAAQPGQASGTPVLGQSFNAVPVSGQVLVKVPGSGFAPLTQTRLLPTGTQVDTLSGKVELISATGNKGNTTQNGTFSGAIFSVSQARSGHNKGLVTAKLLDAACKAHKAAVGPLAEAAVSGNVLSTLHSTSHGKYSSSGHYGSATSRGTAWTLTDRCNSTLITVQKDKVLVHDFVHHRTLTLHAGQHDLIRRR